MRPERAVMVLVLCVVAAGAASAGFALGHPAGGARDAPTSLPPRATNWDPSAPVRGVELSGEPLAPALPLVNGSVFAKVNGYGEPPVIAGAVVAAYSTTCTTTRPLPNTCPVVNQTTTNGSGGFGLGLPAGTYYIAVQPDSAIMGGAYPYGFGGASEKVVVPEATQASLTVYPEVPYGNATLVLPGYVCDAKYLNNQGTGGPGCQNPVLSWTQDGAYYLNSTNELVFYSFVNRTVYPIAGWTPLYQRFPAYAMIPNELFITQDGSYLYSWGTLSLSSTVITVEAVNVTTHQFFSYDFTGVTTSNVLANGQVELTGWDGNDSYAVLITSNDHLYVHDLWSSNQTSVTKLDFFEANNIYWEPYLNGFVNVEAEGSSSDMVEEWQLSGPTNYSLVRTFDGPWAGGRVINGVNGIALNLTDRTLSFALGAAGDSNTVVASLNASGTITGFAKVIEYPAGLVQFGPGAASDRSSLLASGPALQGYYNGLFNATWLAQMTPGHLGYETTNLTGAYEYGGTPASYAWSQWSQEGQFYNASYLIAPNSYACDTQFLDACTVNGSGGALLGTIWWYWQTGAPEFPFPASAPMADDASPAPTPVTVSDVTPTSVALNWSVAGSDGIVYYSVGWGTSPTYGQSVWLPAGTDAYTITGLPTGTRVYFAVEAWNLHFHGASGGVASTITLGPPAPTGLTLTSANSSSTGWLWTQSTGSDILNDTLYLFEGGSCGGVPRVLSTGGPATSETVGNLSPQTLYSAYVTAWNASGVSSPSNCAEGSTLPGGGVVTFTEAGLPTHDSWYVNVTNGPSLAATGAVPALAIPLLNGTYQFLAATNDKTYAPSYTPVFSVNGTAVRVIIQFRPYTLPVEFSEAGLPPGATWSVLVGADLRTTNTSSLLFNETNGTYPYSITDVSGWHQRSLPYRGSIVVDGAPLSEPGIEFTQVTYTVTFVESGLWRGTNWPLSVDQNGYNSTTSTVVVTLPNGSFPFRLGSVGGYDGAPTNGTVKVNGGNATQAVTFTPIPVGGSPWVVSGMVLGLAGTAIAVVLAGRWRDRRSVGTIREAAPPRGTA